MNHVDRAILGVIGGVTLVNFILLLTILQKLPR